MPQPIKKIQPGLSVTAHALIPALGRGRKRQITVDLGQPGLHGKFLANQDCIVRPCPTPIKKVP